jgi:hypothetical protein
LQSKLCELLAEGLILLIRDEDDLQGSEIPRSDTEEVLRQFGTWVVAYARIKVHFTITSAGKKELVSKAESP